MVFVNSMACNGSICAVAVLFQQPHDNLTLLPRIDKLPFHIELSSFNWYIHQCFSQFNREGDYSMSEASLYKRLGMPDKIHQIRTNTYDNHAGNPKIMRCFVNSNGDEVIQKVWKFFCSSMGGPESDSARV